MRRAPFWGAVLLAWWIQLSPGPWGWPERWRPELLLVLLTFAGLRLAARRAACLGLLLGWMTLVSAHGHAWWLLGFWVLAGYGLGWLRTQWYTEGYGLFLALAWVIVMVWHGLTWLSASHRAASLLAWPGALLVGQTGATLISAALWWRLAQRGVPLADAAHD